MRDSDGWKIVEFLRENEVGFTVPGMYDLPIDIVVKAIDEFLSVGESEIIQRHRDWTYGCWDIESIKRNGFRNCGSESSLSVEEIRKLLTLKEFWEDETDIDFLNSLIEEKLAIDEVRKAYAYKRKAGFKQSLKSQCLQRDGYRCVTCGNTANLEVDHIVELVDGGDNDIGNLQALCRTCHRVKTKTSRKKRGKVTHTPPLLKDV